MDQLRIKNWERFQHYKERNPPWIKLHFDILASRDWVTFDDASRVLAVACMLIASRHDGYVPNDPAYIKRVAYLNKTPNLKPLIDIGFLIMQADASALQADARPETDRATEVNHSPSPTGEDGSDAFDGPRPSGWSNRLESTFEEFWKHYPRKVEKGDARKAWQRLKPYTHLEAIHDTLKLQCRSEQWRRENGRYIPYPAHWLAATGWESTGIDKTRLNGEREITQAELESAFDA